jgi:chromosome segregation ATPase
MTDAAEILKGLYDEARLELEEEREVSSQLDLIISQLEAENQALSTDAADPLDLAAEMPSLISLVTKRRSEMRRRRKFLAQLQARTEDLSQRLSETQAENERLQSEIDSLEPQIAEGRRFKDEVQKAQQEWDRISAARAAQSQKLVAQLQAEVDAVQSSLCELDDAPPLPDLSDEEENSSSDPSNF